MSAPPAPHTPPGNQDLLLLRIDALALLNAVRNLARIGWRQALGLAIPLTIILYYGSLLIMAELRRAAALEPHHTTPMLVFGASICLALGYTSGHTAAQRRRRMIRTPWLVIQPLANRQITRALRTAIAADCALRAVLFVIALCLTPALPHAALAIVLIAYGLGCTIGISPATPKSANAAPVPQRLATPHPIPSPLEKIDRLRPAHLGAWALHPRRRPALAASALSFIGSIGIAAAADHTGAAPLVAPALAIIAPIILLIIAINAAPMLSPVLRTSALRYRDASLALLRLPAALALSWLAVFDAIALASRWMSIAQIALTAAAALGLGIIYAITALSLPISARLAVAAYVIALLLIGDQYASLQNFGFLIMVLVAIALLLRARSAYRHGD